MSRRESTQRSKLPGIWVLVRDVGSWVGGWILTYMEVSRPEIRDSVLVLCASLITVPGAAVGAAAVVDSISRRRDGTPEPPSSPQPEAVSPSG